MIVFDNWTVWDLYAPIDYMPCLFEALKSKYFYLPEPQEDVLKLFVRSDRLKR